jgi:hypothetical protein
MVLAAIPSIEKNQLSESDQQKLAELMISQQPFMTASPEAKHARETMFHLFNQQVYEKLKGNYFSGWSHNEDLQLDDLEVAIDELKVTEATKPYAKEFYNYLLAGLQKDNITVNQKSHQRIGLAIVAVETGQNKQSHPGLALELYIKNTQTEKVFYERFNSARISGLKYAMMQAVRSISSNILFFQKENIDQVMRKINDNK